MFYLSKYHFQVVVRWIDACKQSGKRLDAENDSVIKEEVVLVVFSRIWELLIAPEEDDAQVVVETKTATESSQVCAAICLLKNLKKIQTRPFLSRCQGLK